MSTLRLLAPPADIRPLLTWNLTSGTDLRQIRTEVHQFFRANQIAANDDIDQRVALVATELAGNALRHGAPPVVVRLLRDDNCYILDVSDGDPQRAPAIPGAQGSVQTGGRGLRIASSLAEQICWYRTETTKHVWASFTTPRGIGPMS
jgi:serine/threonine-protein kinase RsbW